MTGRVALLVTHTGRPDMVELARPVIDRLRSAGFEIRVLADEAPDLQVEGVRGVPTEGAVDGAEIVLVLGGDGTFLRAAELARPTGAPVLGVNLGRVGFLAEIEPEDLDEALVHLVEADYRIEERLTLDVTVQPPDGPPFTAWALNEASIEKTNRERMVEVVVEIDGRPLTSFGCDGVLFATPTGSTAYAFSAGGPVVWPSTEVLLLVPNNAHALFARPLVTDVDAKLSVRLLDGYDAVLCCDGRRTVSVPAGSRIDARQGDRPVRSIRVHPRVFTDRLVRKFELPTDSLRSRRRWASGSGP